MLSNIIFLPFIGAIIIGLLLKKEQRLLIRYTSLIFSAASLLCSIYLLIDFNYVSGKFAYEENISWIPAFGISYHLGIDSLALALIILNGILSVLGIWSSFDSISHREKEYYIFLLLLQTGINGTFMSLDLILFYIFWEMMLFPLYFLIGIWGSGRKIYATMKFVLFTLAGSVLMLLAIIFLYLKTRYVISPVGSFDLTKIIAAIGDGKLILKPDEEIFLFLAFFFAFAIKVPLFPLHTWLPDAHTEAPTAGSVILAGVLLKTGVYGIIRFCIPLFPTAAQSFAPMIQWLAVIAIIYGAMAAIAQKDMKRLVAYSSVSHMGFIILGLFSFNLISIEGSIIQMINHGISTGGLFLCVGILYNRRHTRLMSEFGGIAQNMKRYAVLTIIIVLSSAGLPGLNGFVGEFTILLGTFKENVMLAAIGCVGVILGTVYLLIMVQKVFFGPLEKDENKKLKDIGTRDTVILLILVLLAFLIGLWASPFFTFIKAPAEKIVKTLLSN